MYSISKAGFDNEIVQEMQKHLEQVPLPELNISKLVCNYRKLSQEIQNNTGKEVLRLYTSKVELYSRNSRIIKAGWYYKVPLIVGIVGLIFIYLLRRTINPFGLSPTGVDGDLATTGQFFSYIAFLGGLVGRIIQSPLSEGTDQLVQDLQNQKERLQLTFNLPPSIDPAIEQT